MTEDPINTVETYKDVEKLPLRHSDSGSDEKPRRKSSKRRLENLHRKGETKNVTRRLSSSKLSKD